MMIPIFFYLFCLNWIVPPDPAQLPDFYTKVAEVHWIVKDLDTVVRNWSRLGFPPDRQPDERNYTVDLRGRRAAVRERVARGHIGGVSVVWIQPVEGESAYSEFLKRHGNGICSLMHRVPTLEALDRETERLRALGIPVLQRGTIGTDAETRVYFDTAKKGKYVLGLIHAPTATVPTEKADMRTSQYAFVVKDMRPVSAFWARLGFPAFSYTHPPLYHLQYHDQPGTFDQELGWQRHGKIEYEWIVPLRGPTVYQDFLDIHGEGVHHLAFEVPDLDRAIARWASLGIPCVQSGSWGDEGKPGWGRYAYIDTESTGGVMLELLWNFRR